MSGIPIKVTCRTEEQFLSKPNKPTYIAMEAEVVSDTFCHERAPSTFGLSPMKLVSYCSDTRLGRYFRNLQGQVNQLIFKGGK